MSSAPIALAPNGIANATFSQTFGTPDPSLTAELVGDLNGDGVQDLLIYSSATSLSFETFTSSSKGGNNASAVQTFSFSPGCSPQLIDFNGDGKPDLLCGALVAYGNGNGTFAQPVPVSFLSSGFDTANVFTADLNGDGKTDILALPTPGESSARLSQVVNAAFTLAPGAGGSTTLTVNAGQTVTAPINVTGVAGFSGQVTFACSGVPANAGCSFSPATINLSGTPAVLCHWVRYVGTERLQRRQRFRPSGTNCSRHLQLCRGGEFRKRQNSICLHSGGAVADGIVVQGYS